MGVFQLQIAKLLQDAADLKKLLERRKKEITNYIEFNFTFTNDVTIWLFNSKAHKKGNFRTFISLFGNLVTLYVQLGGKKGFNKPLFYGLKLS